MRSNEHAGGDETRARARSSGRGRSSSLAEGWEYAPAPESKDHLQSRSGTSSSSAASSSTRNRRSISTRSTRPRKRSSPRWRKPAPRTWTRPCKARRGSLPAALVEDDRRESGKYIYRIARLLQEKSRELAVAGVDGRRQADQGVARRRRPARRRAFLLLRGLGGQARVRLSAAQGRLRSACAGRSSRGTSRC